MGLITALEEVSPALTGFLLCRAGMEMGINFKWLWAHLWRATAEVEEEEEADGMRLARQDGMAREGFIRNKTKIYISTISIPDVERRREEVGGL